MFRTYDNMQKLRGKLVYNPEDKNLFCPDCRSWYAMDGTPYAHDTIFKSLPDRVIPFETTKKFFNEEAKGWLPIGDYIPADILDSFQVGQSKGIYIPLFIYHCEYVISTPERIMEFGDENFYRLGNGDRVWPESLLDFALANVTKVDKTKLLDDIYTNGYEIMNDQDLDGPDQATDYVTAGAKEKKEVENELDIAVNYVTVSKVYVPYWINEYVYKGAKYHIIMIGTKSSEMPELTQPLDMAAKNEDDRIAAMKPPGYGFMKIPVPLFTISLGVTLWAYQMRPEIADGSLIVTMVLFFFMWASMSILYRRRKKWIEPAKQIKINRDKNSAIRVANARNR